MSAKRRPEPKFFVLDTNVLMHDPTSLFRFEEHDIFVPIMTLEELDNNKRGMSEVARNARQASRLLDEIVSGVEDDIDSGIGLFDPSHELATGRLYLQTMVFGRNQIPLEAVNVHAPEGSDGWVIGTSRSAQAVRT